jgi:hypothetical protein
MFDYILEFFAGFVIGGAWGTLFERSTSHMDRTEKHYEWHENPQQKPQLTVYEGGKTNVSKVSKVIDFRRNK